MKVTDQFLGRFLQRLATDVDAQLLALIKEELPRKEYGHVFNLIKEFKDAGHTLSAETEKALEEFFWNYVY